MSLAQPDERTQASAPRTVADLPDFFALVGSDWHLDLIATPGRLMEQGQRGLLRVSDELVVAFRYRDVLDLAASREAGNMPVEVLAGQSVPGSRPGWWRGWGTAGS
jgi:hypothetical protein